MYEHRRQPLIPIRHFRARVIQHVLAAGFLILFSLLVGILGYHYCENMPWIDAMPNAAMILTGMGPLGPLQTTAGKVFATFYALFSGLVFLFVAGVTFAPVVHRFLHRFHLSEDAET
ncbi:MAG: hypothetical protein V1929_07145 [bacterium]